jgi:hypothetical protein
LKGQWKQRLPEQCSVCPLATFHTRTSPSLDPDASLLPSGEKATLWTENKWPVSISSAFPVPMSHILMVPSEVPDASLLPSGEKATL